MKSQEQNRYALLQEAVAIQKILAIIEGAGGLELQRCKNPTNTREYRVQSRYINDEGRVDPDFLDVVLTEVNVRMPEILAAVKVDYEDLRNKIRHDKDW